MQGFVDEVTDGGMVGEGANFDLPTVTLADMPLTMLLPVCVARLLSG